MAFITKQSRTSWKHERLQIDNAIFSKKNKTEGITIPDFKTYYRAIITKMHGIGIKRHIDQWNKIEIPELNKHTHKQLLLNKDAKNIHWKNNNLFKKWCWENQPSACVRLKFDPLFLTLYKNHLKARHR
jgi:hypothetical protein